MPNLYHITNHNNLNNILKEGLIPQIGKNSSYNGEDVPYTYLCIDEHIPYWQILIGNNDSVILKIDGDKLDISSSPWRCYEYYDELHYDKVIPAKLISVSDIDFSKEYKAECMKILCDEFLDSLNNQISWIILEINTGVENTTDVQDCIDKSLLSIHKFDFSTIDNKSNDKINELIDNIENLKQLLIKVENKNKVQQLADAIHNIQRNRKEICNMKPEYYCDEQFILNEVYANKKDNTYGDIYTDINECREEHPDEDILIGYYVLISNEVKDTVGESPDWFYTKEDAESYIINTRYNYLWNASLYDKPTETAPNITYNNLDDYLNKEFNTSKEELKAAGINWDRKMELELDVENYLYIIEDDIYDNPNALSDFLSERGTSIEEMEEYGFDLDEYIVENNEPELD